MSRICQPDFVWNYDRHGEYREYRHYATLARQGNLKSMQRFLLGISGNETTGGTQRRLLEIHSIFIYIRPYLSNNYW